VTGQLLLAIMGIPAVGAGGLLAAPRALAERVAVAVGVAVGLVGLVLGGAVALVFDGDHPQVMQGQVSLLWVRTLGIRFHLGVDGVSLPLVLLTVLIAAGCLVSACRIIPPGGSARSYVALLLALEAGVLATLCSLDLLLFFVAFETVLLPLWFLIDRWGTGARRRAANVFVLYTVLGSAIMLVGLLLLGVRSGTFDMVELAARHGDGLDRGTQIAAFAAIGVGLAVKVPLWPLHTWLPDAHTAAPTAGSVMLAGVLLKLGTYGLIRIAVPMLPEGARVCAPYLAALGVAGIVYGSLACLAQRELKRLIAYSSVGHMGFVMLGIATLTPVGITGALYANLAHGLITGLLFFVVGAVKERHGTDVLAELGGGLYQRAPRLAAVVAFGCVASLGLPGLAGFWGEFLAITGAYRPAEGLSRGLYRTLLVAAAIGTVLTTVYLLGVVRRVCQGTTFPEVPSSWRNGSRRWDVSVVELVVWSPLVVLIVVLGVWPGLVLRVTVPAVRTLVGGSP
jgi:NADH-quinone oxidoreductase subunit M